MRQPVGITYWGEAGGKTLAKEKISLVSLFLDETLPITYT